jgi:biotin transporter BioY
VNSDRKPPKMMVKEMICMLLGSKILQYVVERKEKTPGKSEVTIYGYLAFVVGDTMKLALNNDTYYWTLLPLKY